MDRKARSENPENPRGTGEKRFAAALDAWRQAQGGFEQALGPEAAKNLRAMMKDVVRAVPETGAK
jgi:hypothetical protein